MEDDRGSQGTGGQTVVGAREDSGERRYRRKGQAQELSVAWVGNREHEGFLAFSHGQDSEPPLQSASRLKEFEEGRKGFLELGVAAEEPRDLEEE